MSKDPRGAIVRPGLAALPAVSKPNSYRLVLQGGVLQISINTAAYVPIATGAIVSSPWEETGDPSGANDGQPNVELVNPETYDVRAELRNANVGSGNRAGDFEVAPGTGDGAGRAGELRVVRNVEAETPAGATQLYAASALPAYYGGIYLEEGAIAGSNSLAFGNVPGPWTGTFGKRGDVVSDDGNARVRLGATGGLWLCSYAVTFTTDIDAVVDWAVNYGVGTSIRGVQSARTTAAQRAQVAGETVFDDGAVGLGQQVNLAFLAGGDPAPVVTVIHASLMARRIA